MAKIIFNKNLTLIRIQSGLGSCDPVEQDRKTVRASVNPPSMTLSMQAAYIGQQIDLIAVIRRSDYANGWNYAEYDGVQYHIEKGSAAAKEMFITLILRRS